MKRIEFISALITSFCLLAACDNEPEATNDAEGQEWHTATMVMNVTKSSFDFTTKAADSWKDGDVVYLLFTKGSGKVQGKAVYNASESSWTVNYNGSLRGTSESAVSIWYFDGAGAESSGSLALTPSTGIYADEAGWFSYPSDGDLAVTGSVKPKTGRIRFKGESALSIEVGGINHNTSFNLSTGAFSATDASATLLVQTDGYTPYLYGTFTDTENRTLSIAHGDAVFTANCSANVLQMGKSGWMNIPTADSHNEWTMLVAVKSITLNRTSLTLEKGGSSTLTATVLPANATDKSVKWSTSNAAVASVDDGGVVKYVAAGTAVITASSVQNSSVKATCTVTCKVDKFNGHAYVDLGLTSGTLWATMNVGASKPEDYGDYFAWGETTTKSSYDWSNLKYRTSGDSYDNVKFSKYVTSNSYGTVDNKTELELSDDAAWANWGGSWRMPSSAQIDELKSECNTEWTTQGGVYGRKVTSKKNGNSIFLPAAGYRLGSSLYNAGSYGLYWSRSLDESLSGSAYYLYFYSGDFRRDDIYRYYGQSVRPVASE